MILTSLDELEARLGAPNSEEAMDRFARYCREASIPWGVPRRALVERLGAATWRSFSECVFLPGGELFGLPVTELRAETTSRLDEVPVTSFAAAYAADADVHANHERARAAVAAFAGAEGTKGAAENALEHSWAFGLFGVTLIAFPRERNLRWKNELYERNPDLWNQTTIRLESALAWPDPDDALACIAHPSCRRFDVPRATGASLGPGATETNRLHPTMVRQTLPGDALVAWQSTDGMQGISNRVATISWRGATGISLLRLRPARGPGGAAIDVGPATLVVHRKESGLDGIASELARFYGLPLSATTVDAD